MQSLRGSGSNSAVAPTQLSMTSWIALHHVALRRLLRSHLLLLRLCCCMQGECGSQLCPECQGAH
jgi:hypothetical protein